MLANSNFYLQLYVTYQIKPFLNMALFNLKINGKTYKADVDGNTPLLWVLRDHLDLVGTKYGCGIAMCGACTVHINGEATRSCVLPVSTVANATIATVEGLSETAEHPVQQAWDEVDVPQCGYCQAGQMMTAAALLSKNANPSDFIFPRFGLFRFITQFFC